MPALDPLAVSDTVHAVAHGDTLVATGNAHKLEEFRALCQGRLGVLEGAPRGFCVDEDGATFAANAEKKARALGRTVKGPNDPRPWILADDSGLSVDALDGAPGIYSARYAESAPDQDEANRMKLLHALRNVPAQKRQARFVCALALFITEDLILEAEGFVSGHVVEAPRGRHGFGYDSLFVPDGHDVTFAEGGASLKAAESHRARAVQNLLEQVRALREGKNPCAF